MASPPGCNKKDTPNYWFDQNSAVAFKVTPHKTTFKCRIEGIPRPQYRSFATTKSNSKKVKLWNVSHPNQKAFAAAFKAAMEKANAKFPEAHKNPVFVTVKFFFPPPKKHFLLNPVTKQLHLSPHAPTYVSKTPDIDNCLKLTLDALQKIICNNDSEVVFVQATKLFDHSEHIWNDKSANKGCTLIKVVILDEQQFDPTCDCASCKFKSTIKSSP
jgi:Holliday junction resolvase RusA-like endonuclease